MDFTADAGGQVRDLCLAGWQEVREGWVGILAVVVVLEGLEGRISGMTAGLASGRRLAAASSSKGLPGRFVVPHGEVVRVGGLWLCISALELPVEVERLWTTADILVGALNRSALCYIGGDFVHGRVFDKTWSHLEVYEQPARKFNPVMVRRMGKRKVVERWLMSLGVGHPFLNPALSEFSPTHQRIGSISCISRAIFVLPVSPLGRLRHPRSLDGMIFVCSPCTETRVELRDSRLC
ncbi:hypothetical protein VTO42DRAFT_6553 [Malbranchea cinnamomea]